MPPRITTEPKRESEVSVGQNLTLTCHASGDPLPEVRWNKEGQTLRLFNVTGPILHLVNVTREDVGSYKCTAKNKVGEASRPAVVNIACKSFIFTSFVVTSTVHSCRRFVQERYYQKVQLRCYFLVNNYRDRLK